MRVPGDGGATTFADVVAAAHKRTDRSTSADEPEGHGSSLRSAANGAVCCFFCGSQGFFGPEFGSTLNTSLNTNQNAKQI